MSISTPHVYCSIIHKYADRKSTEVFEIGPSRVFLTEWINPGIMAHTTECHELIQTVSFGDPKLHSEISYLLKQLLSMYTQNSYGIGLYCVLWGPP